MSHPRYIYAVALVSVARCRFFIEDWDVLRWMLACRRMILRRQRKQFWNAPQVKGSSLGFIQQRQRRRQIVWPSLHV